MFLKWLGVAGHCLKGFSKKLITWSDKFWHTQEPREGGGNFLDLYAFISTEIPNKDDENPPEYLVPDSIRSVLRY